MAGAIQLVPGCSCVICDLDQKRPRPVISFRCLSEVWILICWPSEMIGFGHQEERRSMAFQSMQSWVIVPDPAADMLGVTLPPLLESSSLDDHTNLLCLVVVEYDAAR
jgi:hypothetical protein